MRRFGGRVRNAPRWLVTSFDQRTRHLDGHRQGSWGKSLQMPLNRPIGARACVLCLLLGCASSAPNFGSNAPVHPSAQAPPAAPVARMLTEDPFADPPPEPRMMHHGRYVSPVPGTDDIGDEAVPNEAPSQGMGGMEGAPHDEATPSPEAGAPETPSHEGHGAHP